MSLDNVKVVGTKPCREVTPFKWPGPSHNQKFLNQKFVKQIFLDQKVPEANVPGSSVPVDSPYDVSSTDVRDELCRRKCMEENFKEEGSFELNFT